MGKTIFSKLISRQKAKEKAIRKAGGTAPKTRLRVSTTTGKNRKKR